MSTTTPTELSPQDVLDVLSRHILVDGYHVVMDLERSRGSYLYDARSDRMRNLWRNFGATDRTAFGSIVLPATFGGTALEVGGGVVATVSRTVSLFAPAAYSANLTGPHAQSSEGNLGVRVTW